MAQSTQDQKTNIDDLFFPSWLIWIAFWPGVAFWVLLIISLIGFRPPFNHAYFSPTLWGQAFNQAVVQTVVDWWSDEP